MTGRSDERVHPTPNRYTALPDIINIIQKSVAFVYMVSVNFTIFLRPFLKDIKVRIS